MTTSNWRIDRWVVEVASRAMAVLLFCVIFVGLANAQSDPWTVSGNNIFYNAGNVGIGTTNPLTTFHVVAAANPGFFFDGYGLAPNMQFRAANGTATLPTPVTNGEVLGNIGFRGYAGGSSPGFTVLASAFMRAVASEDWSGQPGTGQGAYIYFSTTPTGSTAASQAERMRIDPLGRVGIGTTGPVAPLDVFGSNFQGLRIDGGASARLTVVASDNATNQWNLDNSTGTLRIFREDYSATGAGANGSVKMVITNTGSVGIGTGSPGSTLDVSGTANVSGNETVGGNLTVTGNIAAKYQDVAEWVPSTQSLPAGTVVVLDQTHSNRVIPSSQSYDTTVAGVISANPGVILGTGGKDQVLVATTGRVRVRVDASRAPIHVGDLLVTSDVPGVAMKSQPIDVGGVKIHRPGTLIGKALEPLEKGSGEILVLLSLQ